MGDLGDSDDFSNDDTGNNSLLVDMIMRQLLAKDVLYEPMKEIGERYPAYLAEARTGGVVSSEEIRRYEAQAVYIGKICGVYESGAWEGEGEEEERYEELMDLLQGMQACGQPPEEILRDLGGGGESGSGGGGGMGGLLFGAGGMGEEGGGGGGGGGGCPVS